VLILIVLLIVPEEELTEEQRNGSGGSGGGDFVVNASNVEIDVEFVEDNVIVTHHHPFNPSYFH